MEVGLYRDFDGRSRIGKYQVDHMPSAAVEHYLTRKYGDKITKKDITRLKKRVASLVIPKEVHENCSETYGGRNKKRIEQDSKNFEAAVVSNFSAVAECLRNDYGISQKELDDALEQMHRLNKKEGLY